MKMGFIFYVILDFYIVCIFFLFIYFLMCYICFSNIFIIVFINKLLLNIYCIIDGKDWSVLDGKNIMLLLNNIVMFKIVIFFLFIGICFILLNLILINCMNEVIKIVDVIVDGKDVK